MFGFTFNYFKRICFSHNIYDKCDGFDFDKINFPGFFDSDVTRSSSQFFRFARVFNHVTVFNGRK